MYSPQQINKRYLPTDMNSDNKQKRAPRPVKPKARATQQPAPATAEPVVTLSPEVPPVLDTTAPLPVVEQKSEPLRVQKTRIQTNKAIGVSISAARARRHLDKLNLNAMLDSKIAELKALLATYKQAKNQLDTGKISYHVEREVDGKKTTVEEVRDLTEPERAAAQKLVGELSGSTHELELKIAALSRERTRFSNEASIVLSIVCDELIQQLVSHTMDRVLLAKKKIIQVSHLHEQGIESLPLYPLVC